MITGLTIIFVYSVIAFIFLMKFQRENASDPKLNLITASLWLLVIIVSFVQRIKRRGK